MTLKNDDEEPYITIYNLGVNFFIQGQYKKAQIVFRGLMALFPERISLWLALGDVFLSSGQHEKAVDHFLLLSEKFGPEPKAVIGAAQALVLMGNSLEAKRMVEPIVSGDLACSSRHQLVAKLIFEHAACS